MLSSYQSKVGTAQQQSTQHHQILPEYPANTRKSSNASEASHLLNNCQLIETTPKLNNPNQTTDEIIKAKLNAVSNTKTQGSNSQVQ